MARASKRKWFLVAAMLVGLAGPHWRERDTNVVYHAAPQVGWYANPVSGFPSVATNDYAIDPDGLPCFAAAIDDSSGVLNSVSAWNGKSLFCVEILRAVVAK